MPIAFLDRLTIRSKLYGVTVAMLAALAGVVAFAAYTARLTGVQVAEMSRFSTQALGATTVDRDLEEMGRALLRYIYDREPAAMKLFDERAQVIVAALDKAKPSAPTVELVNQLEETKIGVRALADVGAKLAVAMNSAEEQKRQLDRAGGEMDQAAQDVAKAVEAAGSTAITLDGQRVETRILALKLADWRGRSLGQRQGKAEVEKAASVAQDQLERVAAGDFTGGARNAAGPLSEAITEYADTSGLVIEGIAHQGDVYRDEVAPKLAQMQKQVAATRDALTAEFENSRSVVAAASKRAELTLLTVALVALISGLCVAMLIVRSIAGPLSRLTAGMHRLAEGEFDIVLPGLGQSSEIGEIADAVEAFKIKARERAAEDADAALRRQSAEAQAAARQAAEREAQAREQAQAMSALGAALGELAAKKLSQRLDAGVPAAYARVRDDFNLAISQLGDALRRVNDVADGVKNGSREIANAAHDLSVRTEQQAAQLVTTSSALGEITETVRRTADGARRASEAVGRTRAEAEKSGSVMQRAIDAMGRIEDSSRQVNLIIGVIDEIAFQTNLLALNAGVEAARAGEAGRGFAVVAMEVRGLAQRSADAAKQIKELIATSSAQVGEGVELVAATGSALQRILTQVAEVSNVVNEIAKSANEQSAGLDDVNRAVVEMDQMTQQNAAMAEQATAASRSLSRESEELGELMDEFHFGHEAKAA